MADDTPMIRIYASTLPGIGNVDVEVVESDGRRWSATFFSLAGLDALFEKNTVTGECGRGMYLWASDMIVVKELTRASIETTIAHLRESGDLEHALKLLDDV